MATQIRASALGASRVTVSKATRAVRAAAAVSSEVSEGIVLLWQGTVLVTRLRRVVPIEMLDDMRPNVWYLLSLQAF